MRRISLALIALAVAGALSAGPAGATSRTASGHTAGHTPTFCASFARVLAAVTTATSARDLRKPAIRRAAIAMSESAPAAVDRDSTTFGRAVVALVDHGKRGLRKSEQPRIQAASRHLGTWGARHCPAVARFAAQQQALVVTRRAQSYLRNGLTNAKGLYTDTDSYRSVTASTLRDAEPTIAFTDGPTDPADTASLSVHVVDDTTIVMAAGDGTTCWYLRDQAMTVGTEFARSPGATCDAAAPPAAFTTRWR